MSKPIELGRRKFRVFSQSTAKHDDWVLGTRHRAGLTNPLMQEGEDPEAFARRLSGELSASGEKFRLLAGVLLPFELADLDWTPAIAEETAEFLGNLHDDDDKSRLDAVLATALHSFFLHGLSSPRISRSASGESAAQPAPTGEAEGSGSGGASSEPSPEMISTRLNGHSTPGPFASC